VNVSVFDERKEWAEARGKGLGGTDVSALIPAPGLYSTGSLNPWKHALDVYLGKLGLSQQREPTEAMFWGNYLERGVAMQYAALTKRSVVPPELIGKYLAEMFPGLISEVWNNQTLLHHPDLPFVLGTPDGMVLGDSIGLEIKTSGFKSAEWGKPGSDEIPKHYRIQVAQYMAITGFDQWDVAVLFSGNRLELYTVGRDRELEDGLLNVATEFWHENIEKQIAPPLDGSESWARYLARSYAIGNLSVLKPRADVDEWAGKLTEAQGRKNQAEADERAAKNHLAQLIGENKGYQITSGGKVQWIRPRPQSVTDWEALAQSFNPTPEKIKEHTKEKPSSAYVRLYGGKGE
jgi:predicted phage-related endonuclease